MKSNTFLACLLLAGSGLVLTACNGGEDFADAIVGGGLIDTRPIPPRTPTDDEPAVAIELVVAVKDGTVYRTANVAGLGYRCATGFNVIPAGGEFPFLARCNPAAEEVEFFVGGSIAGERRISLGIARLPMCTGRSIGYSQQNNRCEGGEGYFQVALGDLIPAPSPAVPEMPLSSPARRGATDPEVRNRAAFLAALDSTPADPLLISVPSAAINLAGDAPATDFSFSGHNDFVSHWQAWFALIETAAGSPLRPVVGTQTDAVSLASTAANRVRTGLFTLEHEWFTYSFWAQEQNIQTNLSLTIPLIAMPDGSVGGIGALFAATGSSLGAEAASDLIAIDTGAFLDDAQLLQGGGGTQWEGRTVLDPSNATLSFSGRLIGPLVYDNTNSPTRGNDYQLEFPGTPYAMKPADAGRFSGTAIGAVYDEAPYRIGRTAYVSAVLHPDVLDQLPEFYQITLYKACTDPSEIGCEPIPANEIGPGLNYPVFIDNDNCDPRNPERSRRPPREEGGVVVGCTDGDLAVDVSAERERGGAGYAFASGVFNVQFLADGSVITDRQGMCQPLTDVEELVRTGGINERRVGYVSRTLPDTGNDSANVVLFMIGSRENGTPLQTQQVPPPVPHYGTQVQARIKLSLPHMPMLRLGDENFNEGIRALWQDFYQPVRLATDPGDNTGQKGHRVKALQTGAVGGVALDGSCAPINPAP